MTTDQLAPPDSLTAAVDAVRSFPAERSVSHCGQTFNVSPFAFYGTCPVCGVRFKLRSFAGVSEVEDLFDAVFEWMGQSPSAAAHAQARIAEIAADAD